MPSMQSTLGGDGIAEELAESQRQISIAEFFEKNKHMLGFDSGARALVTAVKEAVDNSLDACEEAGILPDVYVEIEDVGDYYRLVIEDNGPGITKEQLPKVFGKLLYGSRFHKREQSLTPDQEILVRRDDVVESVPVGVLCDAYLPADGEATRPITDDLEVPSFDRERHEMSWQPVTHAIRHETDEATYEITTQTGRTVEVTGNHSLFSVTKDGDTKEVKAGELEPGDAVLAPRRLPSFEEPIEAVNLLEYLTAEQLRDRRVYVSGFDRETLEQLQTGDTVRKRPSPDSERKRTYYRYNGVDIPKERLETDYLQQGYLPADTVIELGWEATAADCQFRTHRVGGGVTEMPVSIPLDQQVMQLLGDYVTEGHVGDRPVGFTVESHDSTRVELTEQGLAHVGGGPTTVDRERTSTRVEANGSPLALFLKNVCGANAETRRVPEFVFRAPAAQQRQFIEAVYQGDGSDAHPGNERSQTTTSETLARQLSVLWNMQGVLASTEVTTGAGYTDDSATRYRTQVDGADVFSERRPPGDQQHNRVPTSVLSDVRVDQVGDETVPDSIPGLLVGAGVASRLEQAAVYQSVIEAALAGRDVDESRYVHDLREMGLLDSDQRPTDALVELWETITNLHGITETDMCLLPVREVEQTDPPEYVYDISVPGATGYDENFVVVNEGALAVKNSRGQQGIGISAAVLYSQLTSGKPAKITSQTNNGSDAQYFELIIDTDTNEPEIDVDETTTWERPHGTRIELEMEANMRARQQLHDYVKHTAVVNPHARLELREPDDHYKFERATDQLPDETEEIRPHPHGVELGTLLKMLEATDSYSVSGFLQGEFTRVGQKTADSVLDRFRDRYFGREMAWRPPQVHDERDVRTAVQAAVANKGKDATKSFAADVDAAIDDRERVSHQAVRAIVDEVAEDVADGFGTTFGSTVRENAVEAAWNQVVGDVGAGESAIRKTLASDLYGIVDAATSSRKDDATIEGMADRLAGKFANAEDRRHRLTREEVRSFVDRAADNTEEYDDATIGETARENVTTELWDVMETVPDDVPNVSAVADDRDDASDLLEAMRETDIIAPPTDCLAPISDELILEGLKKEFDGDFFAAATRDASVHSGDPFIVEAGIAYGGQLEANGSVDVMRFANRVPLVYQRGACATTDVVKQINWRNYGLDQPGGSGMPNGPAVIMIHVASTNVPFTSESKDAVANVPEIESEIELAIREAARDLKSYLNKRRSRKQRRKKQNKLATILPEMAAKLESVTGRGELDIDDSLARIMNNVLVERTVENGTVELTVENNDSTNADLEVTEMVSAQPRGVEDATVVDMDGEWFIKWSPTVESGSEATLRYRVDGDPDFDVAVDGIDEEKLTTNA